MKSMLSPFAFRSLLGLAVAGAALLPATGAFAQATSTPFYFNIENDTANVNGNPLYSVTDSLAFTNLQINEGFANGFSQTIFLPDLDTTTIAEPSNTMASSSPLTSAVLTGTLNGLAPGSTVTANLENSIGGSVSPFNISSSFSADLFNPTTPAIGLGQFALISGNNITDVTIGAAPAAVPEASTTISLGLLMALGLGGIVVARRRTAHSAH